MTILRTRQKEALQSIYCRSKRKNCQTKSNSKYVSTANLTNLLSGSFRSQTFYRIGHSRAHGLEAHRQKGDRHDHAARQQERPPGDLDAIDIVLQPAVHRPPNDGAGDRKCDQDQPQELERQQTADSHQGGTEFLWLVLIAFAIA